MASITTNRSASLASIVAFNLVSRIEASAEKFTNWNSARKTKNVLSNLSDRQLADIGLSRGELARMPNRF